MLSFRFYLILCGAIGVSLFSCRSVKPHAESAEVGAGGLSEAVNPVTPARRRVEQAPKYSDLLLWERLAVTKENSPGRAGVVRCRAEEGFTNCYAQGAGAGEVLIDNVTSQGLRRKILETRQDIESDMRIMADVECDLAGGKLPPYSETDAKCSFLRARSFNELVAEKDVAFEMLASMRGEEIIADTKTELSGVISCRIFSRNIRATCTMRRVIRGGISEDARELPLKTSLLLTEMMISTLSEIQKAQSRPALSSVPAEFAGAARCNVDGKGSSEDSQRQVVCYVRL